MDTHSNEASTRSMNGNLSICETLEQLCGIKKNIY